MQSSCFHFHNPQYMLVLSSACMAECSYCFGPHKGRIAQLDTINKSIEFIEKTINKNKQKKLIITFHGGEPLLASYGLWKYALESISKRFKHKELNLIIQSNLWNLNEDFCQLFREYNVSIGTSLDGPCEINDLQRGKGYFERTIKGIKIAEEYGFDVGCIATFTPKSMALWQQVMDFFIHEKISFSIHPSVKPLIHDGNNSLIINSDQYGTLLSDMLLEYIQNRKQLQISSLDQICRSVAFGEGEVCTYRDCFGMFIVIDPEGDIYYCQRFCGHKKYFLGNICDMPTLKDLENHPNAQKIIIREKSVRQKCADCVHFNYCKGGCFYNALSGGDEIIDPYCQAYKKIFDLVRGNLLKEISSEKNVASIKEISLEQGETELLRKGKIISLTKEVHPHQIAQNAKLAIALYEIAKGPDLTASAYRMFKDKIVDDETAAYSALEKIKKTMLVQEYSPSLNNLYLHLTFNCNLRCTHCYANASEGGKGAFMDIKELGKLITHATKIRFRQIIITGGEPLIHPQIMDILYLLKIRKKKGPILVLRTNLTGNFTNEFLFLLAESFDQIVVSADGNENSHDQRRGKGSYKLMKNNIKRFQELVKHNPFRYAELSLACVMNKMDIKGDPGKSVQELSKSLHIRRVRFRPLLPIGRAKEWNNPPASEAIGSHLDPMAIIEQGIKPNLSCGIGQNLYVEPSGDTFPCYSYHRPHAFLGNTFQKELRQIINSNDFKRLRSYNVDNIEKCKECDYRYLCGGSCRAWNSEVGQYRLDAAPKECEGLKSYSKDIVNASRRYLNNDDL